MVCSGDAHELGSCSQRSDDVRSSERITRPNGSHRGLQPNEGLSNAQHLQELSVVHEEGRWPDRS